MDYNELKELILESISQIESVDSNTLAESIRKARDQRFDIHAVRMALMRYYKQGLLSRQRVGGLYKYGLTQRGQRRLTWLREQTKTKPE